MGGRVLHANASVLELPLAVRNLTVQYGPLIAVDHLSIQVRPHEIYGLLGSNGAGKSSTLKAVVGLLTPADGSISVLGHDPVREPVFTKQMVGYVPETALLYDALTPREFLEFVASVRGLDSQEVSARAKSYVTAFQIEREFDQPLATLSNGTRQKILLIGAFLHQPPLLVLDEPLNSLDPRSVRLMRELLTQYVSRGQRGVLFSTHTMEVAERLCHRVGILDRGRLVGEGTLEALRGQTAQGNATLEEIFLRLTREEEGVYAAVRALGRA
ncbi:MAG: ABC transporter ATP-binding protein [Thermoplasmata archaeon]|nr:ABC transporter ATP-binding protein [Thermoplasmata archaeon]